MLGSFSLTKGGTIYIIIILVLLFGVGFQLIGGFPTNSRPLPASSTTYTPDTTTGTTSQDNLQLKELKFDTAVEAPPPPGSPQSTVRSTTSRPTPTPRPNTPKPTLVEGKPSDGRPTCSPAQDAQIGQSYTDNCGPRVNDVQSPEGLARTQCVNETFKKTEASLGCKGKPVVYLYPTKPTYVDVILGGNGYLVQSIPHYPDGGWKHVLAYPTGMLSYEGNTYRELYYEGVVSDTKAPPSGLVIPTAQLHQKLTSLTLRLGLLPSEAAEFVDYWTPHLEALHAPYVLFSVLDPIEKERVDQVTIIPKPDTMIAFLAYFKPLQTAVAPVKPLILPDPPERKGFTAVEWGGIIGN